MTALNEVIRLMTRVLAGTLFEGKTFAVGGFVRDEQLGRVPKDLDVIVERKNGAHDLTHFISMLFGGEKVTTPHQLGKYPIWQITFKEDVFLDHETFHTAGAIVEFADTMKESFPDEDSRQRETQWGTLEEDVERRDFTCNMLLKDLSTGKIRDITGVSVDDIKKGIIRGHPRVSLDKIFSDDPLRMVRLIRFHCKLGWSIPLSVLKTVRRNAERIKIVSAERIMGELEQVMAWGKLHKAVRLMKTTGLLPFIFPEIIKLQGCKQSPDHHSEGDAFKHTMLVVSNAKSGVEQQMAALLHDIGKPATQRFTEEGRITFFGHENVGAEMVDEILHRLKFKSETIKAVKTLVKNHMRPIFLRSAGEKGLRKFLRDLGEEVANEVLDLSEADAKSSFPANGQPHNFVPELRERVKAIKESPVALSNKPVLSGDEVIETLKITKPGPIIAKAIEFLRDLADEFAVNKKQLTKEEARKILLEKFQI